MKPSVIRALEYIRDHPHCVASDVAAAAWPDAYWLGLPAGGRGGNGGDRGALVAGGLCGKLRRRGLITGWSGEYQITPRGVEMLRRETKLIRAERGAREAGVRGLETERR